MGPSGSNKVELSGITNIPSPNAQTSNNNTSNAIEDFSDLDSIFDTPRKSKLRTEFAKKNNTSKETYAEHPIIEETKSTTKKKGSFFKTNYSDFKKRKIHR